MTGYAQGQRVDEAPLTTQATNGAAVRRAIAARPGAPAGLWGMAILIASEATLFGAFIGTYFYLRFHTSPWPPPGIPAPEWVRPVILVAILAATSVLMQMAWRSVRRGVVAPAVALVALAFVVQAGYFAYEAHDFHDRLSSIDITRNAYTSIYYTLLGADHAHVFVGLLLDVWLLAKLVRGLTAYRATATRAIAWYWHFVNVLTIVVFATVLSAQL